MTNSMALASASIASQPASTGPGGELFRGFSSISNRLTDRLKEGGLGGGIDNILSGVKNFLPARKNFIITRLIEALMDPASASNQALSDIDDYLTLDPRSARNFSAPSHQNKKSNRIAFSEAIVFVVGGGGYVEASNLQEYANQSNYGGAGSAGPGGIGTGAKKITYGATEILSPLEFINSLERLSQI